MPFILLERAAAGPGLHLPARPSSAAAQAAAAAAIRKFPITLWVRHLPLRRFKLERVALDLRGCRPAPVQQLLEAEPQRPSPIHRGGLFLLAGVAGVRPAAQSERRVRAAPAQHSMVELVRPGLLLQ